MRIYFVNRDGNIQEQMDEAFKERPHMILKMDKQSQQPKLGKISLKISDIKFYPVGEGKSIPLNEEKIVTFDVADQVDDSKTGDMYVYVYAKQDGES